MKTVMCFLHTCVRTAVLCRCDNDSGISSREEKNMRMKAILLSFRLVELNWILVE